MKFITALLLFGLAASTNAAAAKNCNRDNCLRGLLSKKFTKECQSYASAAKATPPTFTYTQQVMQLKQVVITPTAVVLCTKTVGEAKIQTTTIYTTLPPAMEAAGTTSSPKLVKRAAPVIPKYASSVCNGDVVRRFISACSCLVSELNTGKAILPPVPYKTTTVVNTVMKYHTTTLPIPTSTITVAPPAAIKTVVEVVKSTPSARPQGTTFKVKLKGGIHDGRYLFPGPVFDEQPGIYYSMFTPNRDDSIDFKISKDGIISSVTGALNLTYSTDFDDDSRYPPEKEGDPMIRVPSFVFLMAAETQAVPDYNAFPIKCKLAGTDLACGAGEKRIEAGWYAFGIDATNYIPTLGLSKPGYDWIYWPGQKGGLSIEWN
ncbi:hypothetical protein TWF506_003242 [Arthrobotrys conoides]|uniref:Uncharacterized protein n=1 Tax=Arthrobotrys conoides TaxID=74498 RepID=A0AAN8RJG7_9PEZI